MTAPKPSSEAEALAAQSAAIVAAFQVLVGCLEENGVLDPGQYSEALKVFMEMTKSRQGDLSAMELRCSTRYDQRRWTSCTWCKAMDCTRAARFRCHPEVDGSSGPVRLRKVARGPIPISHATFERP
jgi:hypothetical protein